MASFLKPLLVMLCVVSVLFYSSYALGQPQTDPILPHDLNQALERALHYERLGNFEKSDKTFGALLETQNDKLHVLVTYTKVLSLRGDFDLARKVLLKVRSAERNNPDFIEWVDQRLKLIESKSKFAYVMQSVSPHDELRVVETSDFVMELRLPQSYDVFFIERFQEIFDHHRKFFNKKLIGSQRNIEPLKLRVLGRSDEFRLAVRNLSPVRAAFYPTTYYDEKMNQLLIYFDGDADWWRVANGIAHHLLKRSYIKKPSLFLDVGLSQYAAFDYAPSADSKHTLTFLKYAQERGEWTTIADLISFGSRLEAAQRNPKVRHKMGDVRKIFEAGSYALIVFFIEQGSEFITKEFREYLEFETSRTLNFSVNFLRFLGEKSASSETSQINQEFQRFLLKVTS